MKPTHAQLFQFAATGALSSLKALAAEGVDLAKEGTCSTLPSPYRNAVEERVTRRWEAKECGDTFFAYFSPRHRALPFHFCHHTCAMSHLSTLFAHWALVSDQVAQKVQLTTIAGPCGDNAHRCLSLSS